MQCSAPRGSRFPQGSRFTRVSWLRQEVINRSFITHILQAILSGPEAATREEGMSKAKPDTLRIILPMAWKVSNGLHRANPLNCLVWEYTQRYANAYFKQNLENADH